MNDLLDRSELSLFWQEKSSDYAKTKVCVYPIFWICITPIFWVAICIRFLWINCLLSWECLIWTGGWKLRWNQKNFPANFIQCKQVQKCFPVYLYSSSSPFTVYYEDKGLIRDFTYLEKDWWPLLDTWLWYIFRGFRARASKNLTAALLISRDSEMGKSQEWRFESRWPLCNTVFM